MSAAHELFLLCSSVSIILLGTQIVISVLLYRFEKSWIWSGLFFFLFFGLQVYVYQIIKLERKTGLFFEHLTSDADRTLWRTIYGLVLVQYVTLFFLFGILTSP